MAIETDPNTIRIFVTSDNHLGFLENDKVRANDSFVSFEECLGIAHESHCDMCIFGGDLFHEHKPSLQTMLKTFNILKKYVMGSRKRSFSILSDQKVNFAAHPVPHANVDDENLNICLPIFSIHGNHDDIVSGVSPLNLLSSSGLLNYFGHTTDLENIELEPILIKKGETYIAVYGLGHVRDERLHRCFMLGKVSLKVPIDKKVPKETKWFRILVLHQNRGVKLTGSKTGIPEHMLIGMADLVIWGNEHQQKAVPTEVCAQESSERAYDIIQPGSTIMTALHSDETNPKAGCIIEINRCNFRVKVHALQNLRPFVSCVVSLQNENISRQRDDVEKFLIGKVEELRQRCIDVESQSDISSRRSPELALPLLRIIVDYTSSTGQPFPYIHQARFGQHFVGTVANPQSIISELRQPSGSSEKRQGEYKAYVQEINTRDIKVKVEDLLRASTKNACAMLNEQALVTAVSQYTEKDEKGAIDKTINSLVESCQREVWNSLQNAVGHGRSLALDANDLSETIRRYKECGHSDNIFSGREAFSAQNEQVLNKENITLHGTEKVDANQHPMGTDEPSVKEYITLREAQDVKKKKSAKFPMPSTKKQRKRSP